jgi:hypothetical protein
MSTDRHLPRPALRRRIEETIVSEPGGITTRELRASLERRARALGELPPGPHQLLRQLGQLLVEARIDECAGVWTPVATQAQARDPHARNRAA